MSLHGSFVSKGGFAKHRNVLTRLERMERLKSEGRWPKDRTRITGLPKVRNIKMT
jgi:small basic protein (TIGR04137 family)